MKADFWLGKWEQKQIGFHRQKPHELLIKHWSQFTSSMSPANDSIFVPLCGKSKDMLYLKEQGFHVIGCELSEVACIEFFKENEIEYSVTRAKDFQIFKSDNIKIYQGDIFKILECEDWNAKVDFVYDRASLIALPHDMRVKYSDVLKKIKAQGIFLITIEFDNNELGPPFSITEEDVMTYLGHDYKITFKAKEKLPLEVHSDKISFLFENIFFLQRNSGEELL